MFKRGYEEVRDTINKNSRYTRTCENCKYFYQAEIDHEELCQNDKVLSFDVIVDENRVYCHHWKSMRGD